MTWNQSTDFSGDITLAELNDAKASTYYGAVVFLGVLMLPGVVGNSHVIHIYWRKYPDNNTRVFVIFLAAIDLLACVFVFPPAMVNYLYPLTLYMDAGCKIFTHLASSLATGEVLTLLAIAVERYRKICKPFKHQFTIRHTRMVCVLILALSVTSTSPVLYLYGSTDRPTNFPNITGNGCNVKLELRRTFTERFFNGVMLSSSICICLVLIVLYTLIGKRIGQHQTKMNNIKKHTVPGQQHPQEGVSNNRTDQSQSRDHETLNGDMRREEHVVHNESHDQESKEPEVATDQSQAGESRTRANENVNIKLEQKRNQSKRTVIQKSTVRIQDGEETHGETKSKSHFQDNAGENNVMRNMHKSLKRKQGVLTKGETEKFQQMKKPLYMFMWITMFYLISYIPYPALLLYRNLHVEWFNNLSHSGLVMFHLAVSFVFLNNVVNSFIYMIFDSNYRREVKSFYLKVFCRRK